MLNPERLYRAITNAVHNAIKQEAKKIVNIINQKYYSEYRSSLGNARAIYETEEIIFNVLELAIEGRGQRALIAEYGKGSLMDLDNPSLNDYLKDEIFNRDRLESGFAVMSRPKDASYKDLDNKIYNRRPPANAINLEKTGSKKYQPVEPKHLILETLLENIDNVIDTILDEIATEVALEQLIDGMEFKVNYV